MASLNFVKNIGNNFDNICLWKLSVILISLTLYFKFSHLISLILFILFT